MKHAVHYKGGYKYQLCEDYKIDLELFGAQAKTEFLALDIVGLLTIRKGYAWDGPSGPAVDTKNFMRGSLVHDAIYQLIREGHLRKDDRLYADRLLYRMCREDGMSAIRATWVYLAVRTFASRAADGDHERKVQEAP